MRIIRPGAELNLKIFECEVCGCLFEANRNEYELIFSKNNDNDIYIKCECSNCKVFANECNKILKEK